MNNLPLEKILYIEDFPFPGFYPAKEQRINKAVSDYYELNKEDTAHLFSFQKQLDGLRDSINKNPLAMSLIGISMNLLHEKMSQTNPGFSIDVDEDNNWKIGLKSRLKQEYQTSRQISCTMKK